MTTTAPFRYDRRQIGFGKPDPVLHRSDCPDAPPDEHAVGYWPLKGEYTYAAARNVALTPHSCLRGASNRQEGEAS